MGNCNQHRLDWCPEPSSGECAPELPSMVGMEMLGCGSFGRVWRASWRPSAGKARPVDVAVKVPAGRAAEDEAARRAFKRESEIVSELRHANVVSVKLASSHQGLPFIVMELSTRGNLRDFARSCQRRRKSRLSNGGDHIRCRMCLDVASGMQYLSQRRLVHRDLAARNVLVMADGKCKITDFGLARKMIESPISSVSTDGFTDAVGMETGSEYAYVTTGGEVPLPIRWSAPELLRSGHCSSMSDVWSFGVLLWEVMAFGETPYSELDATGLVNDRTGIDYEVMLNRLDNGYRLGQPEGCRDIVYGLMRDTWADGPSSRPTFTDIAVRLQDIIGPAKPNVWARCLLAEPL
ncbi:tyrosine-protein kinase CSK-like [Sycon ciliatum]|uniref:tyrosine-protein kinase CSK-like n=1 Tax=Sycon ciliatum TaxID=27933 RepID=UPI0031F63712